MALQILFKGCKIFGYIDGAAVPTGKIFHALRRLRFDPQKLFYFVRKLGRVCCFQANAQPTAPCGSKITWYLS
jgi:hypothetical protein